jgi:hypothetical protein
LLDFLEDMVEDMIPNAPEEPEEPQSSSSSATFTPPSLTPGVITKRSPVKDQFLD